MLHTWTIKIFKQGAEPLVCENGVQATCAVALPFTCYWMLCLLKLCWPINRKNLLPLAHFSPFKHIFFSLLLMPVGSTTATLSFQWKIPTMLRLLCIKAVWRTHIRRHWDNSPLPMCCSYLENSLIFEMHEIVIMNLERTVADDAGAKGKKKPRVMWVTVETECVILELIKALRPIYCKCLHFCN